MDIKDIKIGTKVRLFGKHGTIDNYNNIEDWYDACYDRDNIEILKTQGYGYVVDIEDGEIWVDECKDGIGWCFLPSDLEPYEEFTEQNTIESVTQKTPKEWLLTPMVAFITRNGHKCITLGKGTSYIIETGEVWDNELDENYDNDLNYIESNNSRFDIMSITYGGNVVWERKDYMTLTDAIKTGKNLKLKDWDNFVCPTNALLLLSDMEDELINLFTDEVWEVE